MRRTSRVALGGLALALCIVAHSASAASTAGWSEADRSAATIREFQTRLMVAALRCRAAGINLLASYNQFIAADRAELTAANDRLKTHFKSANPVGGDRDYDRYTTSLANGSAGEQWSPESCDRAARLAREAAASSGNLLAVAARTSEVADAPPPQWSAPAADDRPAPQIYADRGPLPGYGRDAPSSRYDDRRPSPQAYDDRASPWDDYDRDSAQRYRDDWHSEQAFEDRGPPMGYYDNSPSSRPEHAYNEQAPPPGYYDQAPSPYDDRGPQPGYGGY